VPSATDDQGFFKTDFLDNAAVPSDFDQWFKHEMSVLLRNDVESSQARATEPRCASLATRSGTTASRCPRTECIRALGTSVTAKAYAVADTTMVGAKIGISIPFECHLGGNTRKDPLLPGLFVQNL